MMFDQDQVVRDADKDNPLPPESMIMEAYRDSLNESGEVGLTRRFRGACRSMGFLSARYRCPVRLGYHY